METLATQARPASATYQANEAAHTAAVASLRERLAEVALGGNQAARERHIRRGKLLPRERVERLVDRGSALLEIGALAADGVYQEDVPAAGLITAIGEVHGRKIMIIANDATVKGGTYMPLTVKKHLRAQEIAAENELPCVSLVDSGGAFLPLQDEVFPDREHFGRIFFNQARMSARGIAQIAAVMGSSTAGGAYVPAMSDEVVIVREQGTIFLGGPPLVRAATGEVVTAEELGGGITHTRDSGVADHLADNDEHALEIVRDIIAQLPAPAPRLWAVGNAEPPRVDPAQLYGVVPPDPQSPYDAREVIARLVDGSEFHEFKRDFGATLITGFARIEGHPVGIIANNGVLFAESAQKGAHFVQLCDARQTPIVFLQNLSGFMVGRDYERGGIAKHGAKMVTAVACASVPKLTVVVGGSFGAGNYAMSGRAYSPRFMWMWPTAKIGVMGGPQAASVLTTVKRDQLEAAGETLSAVAEAELSRPTLEQFARQSDARYASARLWDDGIIDPLDTRTVLGFALDTVSRAPLAERGYGIFRM